MEQCPFYKWGEGHFFGTPVCTINDKKISTKQVRHYCKGFCDNYHNCRRYQNVMSNNNIFEAILNLVSINSINKEDKDKILKTLNRFRNDVLEKNIEHKDLLVYHDRMSKVIVDAIKNTRSETINEFIKVIYEIYILKMYEFIINKDKKNAILKYQELFNLLIKYFSLDNELDSVKEQYKHPERYGRYALKKVM